MTAANWTSEYLKLIDECEKFKSKMSEWESQFVDSIRSQLAREKPLSSKQIEKLESIWDNLTRL